MATYRWNNASSSQRQEPSSCLASTIQHTSTSPDDSHLSGLNCGLVRQCGESYRLRWWPRHRPDALVSGRDDPHKQNVSRTAVPCCFGHRSPHRIAHLISSPGLTRRGRCARRGVSAYVWPLSLSMWLPRVRGRALLGAYGLLFGVSSSGTCTQTGDSYCMVVSCSAAGVRCRRRLGDSRGVKRPYANNSSHDVIDVAASVKWHLA